MANKQIPIEQAKLDELRDFAERHLGLQITKTMTKAEIASNIKAAWVNDYILVEDAEVPNEYEAPARALDPNADLKPGYVRLIVQIVDEPGGEDAVPVGVNGRVMLVPRGEQVDIPQPYYEVLKHAVRHVYDPLRDGGMSPIPRKVAAYPHQVIAARPAEQAA